uniref:N-terminal Ras-GEF domain-containing protein n=1 Tax=Chelonoidis abingdonii TaxID=106734 RepID=A0A8C0G7P5_CHEAB
MPQTLSSTSMFTPCGFSPHLHSAEEDDQGGLIFQDGNLASASLDALIQHLIPTTDYYPEKAYIFTFLLSSRLFIEPHELLSRVCHKCVEQQRLDDPVLDKARIRKFGPKLLQLLTEWTETFPYDFQEERMIGHLKDMIDRIAPCDEVRMRSLRNLHPQGILNSPLCPVSPFFFCCCFTHSDLFLLLKAFTREPRFCSVLLVKIHSRSS